MSGRTQPGVREVPQGAATGLNPCPFVVSIVAELSATFANDHLRMSCGFVKIPPRAAELMPTKLLKTALPGRPIGYARVSTEEQDTDPQLDELHWVGCAKNSPWSKSRFWDELRP
jgi:hypothetical protein